LYICLHLVKVVFLPSYYRQYSATPLFKCVTVCVQNGMISKKLKTRTISIYTNIPPSRVRCCLNHPYLRLATGCIVRGSDLDVDEIFQTRPDRLRGYAMLCNAMQYYAMGTVSYSLGYNGSGVTLITTTV
jgi:hypothetical protein